MKLTFDNLNWGTLPLYHSIQAAHASGAGIYMGIACQMEEALRLFGAGQESPKLKRRNTFRMDIGLTKCINRGALKVITCCMI